MSEAGEKVKSILPMKVGRGRLAVLLLQASVMLELLQFIDGILKRSLAEERKNKDNDERPTLQMGLLCCAILLTSTAFDVILGGLFSERSFHTLLHSFRLIFFLFDKSGG